MITCYIPKIEDLWFKETMLADPDTMSYNHAWGGTISFPKEHGIRFLFDNIAIDNPAISLFLKHDFVEDYRDNDIVMLKKEL